MARKLYLSLLLAVLMLSGCGKVKKFFTIGPEKKCHDQLVCDAGEYEPENIIVRQWPSSVVEPMQPKEGEPSPYITGYSELDYNYPATEYETWSRKNAKRVIADPIILMKDVVTAPFKYSRDKYRQYKETKQENTVESK